MVASGVTVPRASMRIGRSSRRATAWPTVELAPAKAPGPPSGVAERLIRYRAPPISASTTKRASRLPSQRRRREGGRRAGWLGEEGSAEGDDICSLGDMQAAL